MTYNVKHNTKQKQEDGKMKITNIRKEKKQWFFENSSNPRGTYYTDRNGEGLFFQSSRTGETKQIIGTCQFSACETSSGMRKKVARTFGEEWEEPRI